MELTLRPTVGRAAAVPRKVTRIKGGAELETLWDAPLSPEAHLHAERTTRLG